MELRINGTYAGFPISRDPPEGGTDPPEAAEARGLEGFQFLGIPPKGEPSGELNSRFTPTPFPISRDPPEGGTRIGHELEAQYELVSNF